MQNLINHWRWFENGLCVLLLVCMLVEFVRYQTKWSRSKTPWDCETEYLVIWVGEREKASKRMEKILLYGSWFFPLLLWILVCNDVWWCNDSSQIESSQSVKCFGFISVIKQKRKQKTAVDNHLFTYTITTLINQKENYHKYRWKF